MPEPGELPSYPGEARAPTPTPKPSPASAPVPASIHQIGELVGGRYRLSRMLGHGAITETWEASHVELERAVAIKFLRQQAVGIGEKMLEEARAVARIHHPHVVEFSDFGRVDSGDPYFVMELLAGQTLEQLIARRGTVAWARAVHIAQQAGSALAAAHQQGIVHRDLRPGNVFLVDTGEPGDFVKVVDFGLARGTTVGGTVAYMSPEQCRNEPLDPRSDVYALGCLLYTMITSDPPFVGDPDTLRWRQISEAPKPLRERAPRQFIPDELEAIVARCLEKDPARRFPDIRELAGALGELANFAASVSVAGGVIQDPSASASRPMGFAGRPPPKNPEELTNSYKAIDEPIEEPAEAAVERDGGLGVGAIVGIVLASLVVAGAAGVGVWWLVTTLIHEEPVPSERTPAVESEAAQAPGASQAAAPEQPAPEGAAAAKDEVEAAKHEEPASEEPAPEDASSPAEEPAPPKPKPSKHEAEAASEEPTPAPEEPTPEPEPEPEKKPSMAPDSKANQGIGHEELLDPWQ
jgi:hypothetical protein